MSSSATPSPLSWGGLSTGTRIAAVASVVLLVSCFLAWVHVSAGPISASASGWSAYFLGKVAALAALVSIGAIAIELLRPDVTLPVHPALITLGCGAIALFCALFRIVFVPSSGLDGVGGIDVGPSFGVFLAALAAAALAYGGWRRMNES